MSALREAVRALDKTSVGRTGKTGLLENLKHRFSLWT